MSFRFTFSADPFNMQEPIYSSMSSQHSTASFPNSYVVPSLAVARLVVLVTLVIDAREPYSAVSISILISSLD